MSRPKLASLLTLVLSAAMPAWPQTVDDLMKEGAAAFARNDCAQSNTAYAAAGEATRREGNHAARALAQRRLGICAYRVGDNARALAVYREGIEAARAANHRALLAENTHGAALALRHLGQFTEALTLAEQEYALAREDGRPAALLPAMTMVSQMYGLTGRGQEELQLLEKALAIAREAGDRAGERIVLSNLSYRLVDFGDLENAMVHIRAMMAAADPNDRPRMAEVYSNAGVLLRRAGKPAEARESYRKALELTVMPRDWRIRSAAIFNLAMAEEALGRPEEAREVLEDALAMAVELKNDDLLSRVENQRSTVFRKLGRRAEALQSAGRALTLGRGASSPERVIEGLLTLGSLREDSKEADAARSAYREALELIESIRAQGPADPEQLRLDMAQTLPAYQTMVRFEARQGDAFEALRWAEQAKARVLTGILSGGGLGEQRAMNASEREEERALRSVLEAANRRFSSTGASAERSRAAEAAAQLDAFRLRLYGRRPELGSGRAAFAMASRAEILELVVEGAAAIEYFQVPGGLAAFVVRRGKDGALSTRVIELPVAEESLRAEVGAFRAALAQRDLTYGRGARQLYDRLLKPLEPHLAGAPALTISPDGPLWELPFGALMDGRGQHLVDTRTVSLAPSLTALARMRQRHAAQGYGPVPFLGIASAAPPGAPPIPEAAAEVEAIAALYPKGAAVFTGARATEAVFRQRAPEAAIVHVASHAELNNIAPLYSFLHLDRQTISARDLLELSLRARLVVLSACETARGKLSAGEGLIGLGWAVTAAGAGASIVSQWKVDSASTASLMLALHRNVARHRPLADALRAAVLETRKLPGYEHPFYWAAFTLMGDGR